MPYTKKNKIPHFVGEDQEREFWNNHDSTDYVDWTQAKDYKFENLKPSVKSISIRLPDSLIGKLKMLANKRDVPYQSLLKIFLSERVDQEFREEPVTRKSLAHKR